MNGLGKQNPFHTFIQIKKIKVMTITYDLDKAKQNVISLVKQYSYDFCSDIFKEIKQAANNDDVDAVEMFVKSIRKTERVAEEQVRQIEEAYTITDILVATAGNESAGNVLYECDEVILKAIFDGVIFEKEILELPF